MYGGDPIPARNNLYIPLYATVLEHPKTLHLADLLDIEPEHAMMHMACIWLWALTHVENGSLKGISPRGLARIARWPGDGEAFATALRTVGFLNGGKSLHDWQDYAGKVATKRQHQADWIREKRHSQSTSGRQPVDVDSTSRPVRRPDLDLDLDLDSTPNGVHAESDNSAQPVTREKAASVVKNHPPKHRKPDPLWDALIAALNINVDDLSRGARGKINAALKQMREIPNPVTPEEIPALVREHVGRFDFDATPNSLASNIHRLREPQRATGRNKRAIDDDGWDEHRRRQGQQ